MSASRDDLLLFLTLLKPLLRRRTPLGEGLRAMRGDAGLPDSTVEAMAREIEDGTPLSETMQRRPEIFPAPLPALVEVGERTGDLLGAVERAIAVARHRMRVTGHLRAGLIYPGICLALVLGLVVLHAAFNPLDVIGDPSWGGFARTDAGARGVVALAMRYAMPVVGLAVGVAVWLLFFRSERSAALDRARLDLPLVGRLYRLSAAAGFTRSLGALLDGALPVDRAVAAAVPSVADAWVARELTARLSGVRDGQTLSAALSLPGIFPPSLGWRLAVAERDGSLPEALRRAADAYQQELEIYAGRLARLVEPAGIFIVGIAAVVVVWIWFGRLSFLMNTDAMGGWF